MGKTAIKDAIETDGDLAWLVAQAPSKDTLDAGRLWVEPILRMVENLKAEDLPFTVGVFGSWGCGKTTLFALLARRFFGLSRQGEPYRVVYFNAWKYAGFMEMVPALVYKVLRYTAAPDRPSQRDAVVKVLLSLGKKYGEQFGEWTEKRFGINLPELTSDLAGLRRDWKAQEGRRELMEAYYTQVDRAQDSLLEIFRGHKTPTIVLIDELDRCDPGEAFDAIKKLRVFFAMRGVPIVFLIGVNPDPIGSAIRHQYGLPSDTGDYEARRILEKFVDTYVDLSEAAGLGAFVRELWKPFLGKAGAVPLVARLDRHYDSATYAADTIRNTDAFMAFSTGNFLYGNVRVLRKSLHNVVAKSRSESHLWCKWHLEMLRLSHSALRRKVAHLAHVLSRAAVHSHLCMLRDLHVAGRLDQERASLRDPAQLQLDKGNTAFSVYRSWFWEHARKSMEAGGADPSAEAEERVRAWRAFLGDFRLMDFLTLMTLVDLPLEKGPVGDWLRVGTSGPWPDFQDIPGMRHFAWALANY